VTSSSTWPLDSPYAIHYLPIGDPLGQSLYLQPHPRHWALSILGSRPWPYRVTWHHWSRDQLILRWPFPIGAPLSSSLYLQPFSRYWALSILGSRPWPLRVTWRHRSRDHWTLGVGMGHFLLVVLWTQVSISNGFRDISPKHHVECWMLNRHCACSISRDVYPFVKFKYIFQFLIPTLLTHYATFIGLRWRISKWSK